MRSILAFLALVSMLHAAPVRAEEPQGQSSQKLETNLSPSNDLTQVPIEQLLNIQITSASKYAQNLLNSPHAISVVTREDIEKSGALTLPEVLKFVEGLFVFEHGNKPEVIMRAAPQEFIPSEVVLLDGFPLYNPSHGNLIWPTLPLFVSDIERVEIIRGAASTLYGQNAFSGVINIISKKIEDREKVSVFASGGNLETTKEEVVFSKPLSDVGKLRLAAEVEHDNGYGANNGDGQFDSITAGQGKGELEFQLSKKTHLYFYSYGRTGNLDWPNPVGGNIAGDFRFVIDGLRFRHEFSPRQELSFQTTYINDAMASRSDSPAFLFFTRQHFNSDLNYVFHINSRDTLVAGANSRTELNKANFLAPGYQAITLASFFVNNDFKILDNLILTTGGRYEWDNISHSQLTGRLNLSYLPTEHHAVRVSVARAVRTPTLLENRLQILDLPAPATLPPGSVLDILGNPNLKAESEITTELGYHGFFLNNRLSVDAQFYFNFVDNTITPGGFAFNPASTPPQATINFINNPSSKVYGLETEIAWRNFDWWNSSISYTLTQQSGFQISEFPTNLLTFKNRIALNNGFSSELLFNWASPSSVFNRGLNQKTKIGNIFRLDARLAQKFYKKRLEVAVVGENLVNAPRNESSLQLGSPLRVDRRIFGTLSFAY